MHSSARTNMKHTTITKRHQTLATGARLFGEMAGKVALARERIDAALEGPKRARLPLAGAALPLLRPFVVCSTR